MGKDSETLREKLELVGSSVTDDRSTAELVVIGEAIHKQLEDMNAILEAIYGYLSRHQ